MTSQEKKTITKDNCHDVLRELWACPPMPFNKDYSLDLKGLADNVRYFLENNCRIIAFPTGVAEIWSVTLGEFAQMVSTAAGIVNGKSMLVASVNYRNAVESIEMAHIAENEGADLIVVGAPPYPGGDEAQTVGHFSLIAESTGLPMKIYQGAAVQSPLTLEVIEKLVEIPNIVAYKEYPYNPSYFYNLSQSFGDVIALINGARGEGELRQIFYREAGAVSYWSSLMNYAPSLAWRHWEAWLSRDYDVIREVCDQSSKIFKLYNDMYDEFYPTPGALHGIAAYKELMSAVGLAGGVCRPPLSTAGPEWRPRVIDALKSAGIDPISDYATKP